MKPPRKTVGKAGTQGTKPLPDGVGIAVRPFPVQPTPPLASERLTRLRAEAATKKRTASKGAIGKLPLMLEQGGLDAALWPWFHRWIENPHNRSSAEWHAISDKRRYFVALVACVSVTDGDYGHRAKVAKMFEVRSVEELQAEELPEADARRCRRICEHLAPNLTRCALPLLRKRFAKLTLDDYKGVTRNPSPDGEKFPLRSHDKRAKLRAGLKTLPKFLGAP